MKIPKEELIAILSQFNPWWRRDSIPDLPSWRRAAFQELMGWIISPPAARAVMIPAALFCYWLGSAEFKQSNILI